MHRKTNGEIIVKNGTPYIASKTSKKSGAIGLPLT
jgi:hypothetical protein